MDFKDRDRFVIAVNTGACDVVDSMLADGYIPKPRDIYVPCEVGNVDMLLRLLKYPMDLQIGLIRAIRNKQIDIYDHLFVAGVDINLPNEQGNTSLCFVEDPVTCKWLLDMGARHIADNNNDNPLSIACSNLEDIDDNDNIEIIKLLLVSLGDQVVEGILKVNKQGKNALHQACFYKRTNVVELLLDCLETHGYPIEQAIANGDPNCINIVSTRCLELLEVLLCRLGNQASQNISADHLCYACSHSDIEAMELLFLYFNSPTTQKSSSSSSSENSSSEIFSPSSELGTKQEYDINDIVDEYGNTLLHFAVEHYMFEWLLEKGAKQLPNKKGNTPLHNLCSLEYNELVYDLVLKRTMKDFGISAMIEKGGPAMAARANDIDMKFMFLHLLSAMGGGGAIHSLPQPNPDNPKNIPVVYDDCLNIIAKPNIIKLLLDHSPTFTTNNKGSTPLHEACLRGNPNVVRVLLQHLGDQAEEIINQPDSDGNTPLDLAVHHPKIVSLLECYI